jgi:hypothetical protein
MVVAALGVVGASAAVGLAGGALGTVLGREGAGVESASNLPRLGLAVCLTILPLLFVGGLVTSTESGMAVADWPTSYGANMFLYPLHAMTGGVYYEHAHRLLGALVGLTTLVLMVGVVAFGRGTGVRVLAVLLFAAVLSQGILGGLRVREGTKKGEFNTKDVPASIATDPKAVASVPAGAASGADSVLPGSGDAGAKAGSRVPRPPTPRAIAMVHGISAQIILGMAVALAAMLTPTFRNAGPARVDAGGSGRRRKVAVALAVCSVVQLGFGAATRHFGGMHATTSHVVFAIVVAALAAGMGFMHLKAAAGDAGFGRLWKRLGKGLVHTVAWQMALGVGALWAVWTMEDPSKPTTARVILGTLHQFNGAVLLALVSLSLVWTLRLVARKGAAS